MDLSREKQLEYIDKVIDWCFLGIVFILPIAHTMTIRSVFMYLPLLLWMYKMWLKREVLFEKNRITFPFILFALVAVSSLLTAADPAYTAERLIHDMAVQFMLFFLLLNNVRGMAQADRIILSLLLGSLVEGVLSLISFIYSGGNFVNYEIKASGLTAGYITYSVFLVIILPFAAYKVIVSEGRGRAFFVALLLLNTLMLYFTFQRGAVIALIAEAFLFLWLLRKRVVCAAIVVVFAAVIFILPSGIVYHGEAKLVLTPQQKIDYSNTINTRIGVWWFVAREIAAHPFAGIGYGRYSFAAKYHQFRRTDLWHAHNTFLNLTLQLGVQGLAVFLLVLYRLASTLMAGIKSADGKERYFFIAMLVFMGGFFIRNLFDDLYVDDSAQIFWVLVGTAFAVYLNMERLASRAPAAVKDRGLEESQHG